MCLQVEGEVETPAHQQALKRSRRAETQEVAEALQPQGTFQMPSGPPGQLLISHFLLVRIVRHAAELRSSRVAAFETYNVEYLLLTAR